MLSTRRSGTSTGFFACCRQLDTMWSWRGKLNVLFKRKLNVNTLCLHGIQWVYSNLCQLHCWHKYEQIWRANDDKMVISTLSILAHNTPPWGPDTHPNLSLNPILPTSSLTALIGARDSSGKAEALMPFMAAYAQNGCQCSTAYAINSHFWQQNKWFHCHKCPKVHHCTGVCGPILEYLNGKTGLITSSGKQCMAYNILHLSVGFLGTP